MDITYTRPACEPDVSTAGVVECGAGRYEFNVWRLDGQWYAAFPDYHACSKIGSTPDHRADYVAEKMRVSMPDAEVMAAVINLVIRASRPPSMSDFLGQVLNG